MDATTRTFFVAGVKFRPPEDIKTAGDFAEHELIAKEIKLVGEPQNKYDRYAVKVHMEVADKVFHIGYIPKPINIDIWALRDAGWKPTARLVEYNANGPTHEMFKVEVSFTKNEKQT